MSQPLTDGERLAVIASRYQPSDIIVSGDGSAKQLLIKRDPRRTFIRFRQVSGGTVLIPYAGELPSGAVATSATFSGEEYKAKDSPGLVTGEWYAIGTDALAKIEILTDTYVGE